MHTFRTDEQSVRNKKLLNISYFCSMTDNLRKKTTNSIIWNAIDKIGFQMIAFVVGVVTARLLTPDDFGLIGALAIFTLLSNTLVEGGFTSALIRRENNTDEEYTAAFYFNLFLSVFFYAVLYFSAPLIASFFKMPELCNLSRLLFLAVVLQSLGLVQNIILTKQFAFRILTIANVTSVILSGIITIVLIYFEFGYWALAWQIVLQVGFRSLLLWVLSSWRIKRNADFKVIKELFSFSTFLLINSIFVAIVKYIYNIIIGRLYTKQDLGYYSQAYKYQQIPSSIITATFSGVAYPVLSELNNNSQRQLAYFRKIMRITAFVIFPVMTGLCLMAEPLFSIVLTDKWLPAVPYFQILSIAAFVVPFHTLNLTLITVKGFPKMMFLLEFIRNILVLISLYFFFGNIQWMLFGFLVASYLSYFTDLFFIRKVSGYKIREQILDILPYFVISIIMGGIIYLVSLSSLNLYLKTFFQLMSGASFYLLVSHLLGSKVIRDAVEIFRPKSNKK